MLEWMRLLDFTKKSVRCWLNPLTYEQLARMLLYTSHLLQGQLLEAYSKRR
jgi:hypothetical protein